MDAVGIPHDTGEVHRVRGAVTPVVTWEKQRTTWSGDEDEENKERIVAIVGPPATAFPANRTWQLGGWKGKLSELTIKTITKELALRRFKKNPAPAAWVKYIPESKYLNYTKIWTLRSYFTTPRDRIPWLKAVNRTLYLHRDKPCPACNRDHEQILHIARCPTITRGLWSPLLEFMQSLGITTGDRADMFFIFGHIRGNKYACPDAWGLIILAWRCIYAAIFQADDEGTRCNVKAAFLRTLTMARTRLTAYGAKWRNWSTTNRLTNRKSMVPLRHRKKKLFECDAAGDYGLNEKLRAAIAEAETA